MCDIPQGACSFERPASEVWTFTEAEQTFRMRALTVEDHQRRAAYQALRYRIFSQQLHWHVVVNPDGREADVYDERADGSLHIHTLSQVVAEQELLLGGVRTNVLHSWEDAMVMQEMRAAELFPAEALSVLRQHTPVASLLEVTRMCLERHTICSRVALETLSQRDRAQDWLTAGVYQVAEQTERTQALAVVSAGYLRLLQRAGYVLHACYTWQLHHKLGYALIVMDLKGSVRAMLRQGHHARVSRLLALCQNPQWLT